MKVILDSTSGKHVRYGVAIAKKLRQEGHECWLTTRQHPDTISVANHLDERVEVMGSYGGKSLESKLVESAQRIISLAYTVEQENVDLAISHGSVELPRVAFGLGIPLISTWDSPHAEAVENLTLPLCKYIVASECMRGYLKNKYPRKELRFFHGVDELAWLYQTKNTQKKDGFNIVYREFENAASYATRTFREDKIVNELSRVGNVHVLKRNSEKFVDALSLVGNADLVVGYGGTIGREAALLGTPSVVIDAGIINQSVNVFLADEGFPIEFYMYERGLNGLSSVAGAMEKKDVKQKIAKLENPVDLIQKIVEEERKK